MAKESILVAAENRHPLCGKKQSPEHIAKRVASIKAAKSAWTDEKRLKVSAAISEAQKIRAAGYVSCERTHNKITSIYALSDPRNGNIRYVGKTVKRPETRLMNHETSARRGASPRVSRWIASLLRQNLRPKIEVLEVVQPGSDWVAAEQKWIAKYRELGVDLVNHCDGGQGTPGIKFSKEHVEKLRKSHLGIKPSQESIEKRKKTLAATLSKRRRKRTPEQIAKAIATKAARRAQGLYGKRRKFSPQACANISAAKKAAMQDPAYRAKFAGINKGRKLSPERRAQLSDALKLALSSPEAKARKSEAMKRRHAARRAAKAAAANAQQPDLL